MKHYVTSECVGYGHPDKIADLIASKILDDYLTVDKNVRAGIEVMVKDNIVVLGGEISSTKSINYDDAVKYVYKELDFPSNHQLSPDNIKIINLIGKQSPEIANKVEKYDGQIGAGDQGFMVGYAVDETPELIPVGYYIARCIAHHFSIKSGNVGNRIGPDTKAQVIMEYDDCIGECKAKAITVSCMHQGGYKETVERIKDDILRNSCTMITNYIHDKYIVNNPNIEYNILPGGEWRIGGPISDCGVTGRKLVVDSYGGHSNIGGGAYAGKDMSKVDKSGAFMARYLAKNIVAAGLANEAKVTLSYTIGKVEPDAIDIKINNDDRIAKMILDYINENIDLSPKGIMERFEFYNPLNFYNAKFGYFGFDLEKEENFSLRRHNACPWENVDLKNDLRKLI